MPEMNSHRLALLLLVLFTVCFGINVVVATGGESGARLDDEDELAVQRWTETFGTLKKWIGSGIRLAMPYLMSRMSDKDLHVSQQCRRALFQWIADIKSMQPWALEMGDASAKFIDGIFKGTFSSFGSFDQCLDIANPKGDLKGQYCSLEFWARLPKKPRFYALNKRLKTFERFENNTGILGEFTKHLQLFYMFPLRLGICIPSPCSVADISNISVEATKNFKTFYVSVPRCEVKEPVVIQNYQIPMFCVVVILLLLVAIGTLYDFLIYRKRVITERTKDMGIISDFMMTFSAAKSWNKLMDLDAGTKDLSVLHGIRFYSMCWIILGHTYFHLNFNTLRHLQITIELTSQFIFNAVTNASLVVDNFFFISGLLYVYVTMETMKVTGKIPRAVYFIIHRFWRFLPIQMFFVGCSTLLPLFGSGPTWHENIDPIVEGCKKDWWANMIFINNLYRSTEKGCLSYSWYLAADFQIYIFCIPIVILIIRKPRIGLWINFVVMILSVIAVAVHNYVRDLPPTMLFTRSDLQQRNELMRETYYTPYRHVGPYCIGLFVGYYLQTHKKPLELHWSLRLTAWLATLVMTSAALFGVHPWNQGIGETGIIPSILYASLSRMAWTVGIAWTTVACARGCGGIVTKILRNKVYAPFSRLTFLVYMVHPLVQHVFYGTLRDGIQAKNHLAIFTCLAFIVVSYAIALILSLLIESPFISMGFLIFRRRESAKKKKRSQSFHDGPLAQKTSHWNSTSAPPLINSNGKCNGAFIQHSTAGKDSERESLDNGHSNGDFICHL